MRISNLPPFWRGVAYGTLILGALFLIALWRLAPSAPPTATSTTNANAPALTCQTIFSEYDARSTDLQKFQYVESILHKPFACDGVVNNVLSTGVIYLAPGSSRLNSFVGFQTVILHGAPASDAARFRSGDRIVFDAIARRSAGNIGLTLEADFVGWRDNAATLEK